MPATEVEGVHARGAEDVRRGRVTDLLSKQRP